ncbi:SDR family oxidoreductase [Polynucleobacter kasalickyi]|uniref:NAD(P)-dependent dehydrogenase, short-chain alcohol dehydrogenase family n=1 Tax=Polynucleobacter kasalickyi TaxID=1938817 RepID=A0A1W1Y3M1_9BURK|nr:SDR family oxidoreductase [Polynucleobacter kasalickyi]SMC30763.1 NAD(P)-dependent dehydrogenase, short-chain alcohol dehydrogenase family [Polynucleobacter kasalickyi]
MTSQFPIALVTGAGTGIGKACAHALVQNGYHVIFTGRRIEVLQQAITELKDLSNQATPYALDISKIDQVQGLFQMIDDRFGRLDVLFNNAGRGTPVMDFDEIPHELWAETVGTNLMGAIYCSQGAFKLMKNQSPQGGRIINNGSISAHTPRPYSAPYTSTKHAITGLTKSLALDGRKYNIACGQIDIGNAATEMTDRMAAGIIQADGSIAAEDRMDVNHVAQAVVQMAKFPLESNVLFMTIMATKMPFVGRG